MSPNKAAETEDENQDSLAKELIYLVVWVVTAVVILRSFVFEPYNIPSPSMVPVLEDGDFIYVSKYSYGYGPKSFMFDFPITKTINGVLGRDADDRVLGKLPERGDIVVFRSPVPEFPKRVVVKRLIGLPGDTIETKNGILYINGEAASYDTENIRPAVSNSETAIVPGLSVFVDETFPTIDGQPGHTHTVTDLGRPNATDNFSGSLVLPSLVKQDHLFFMGDNRDNSGDSRARSLGQVPMANVIGQAHFSLFSVNMPLFKSVFQGRTSPLRLLAVWDWMRWDRFGRPLV